MHQRRSLSIRKCGGGSFTLNEKIANSSRKWMERYTLNPSGFSDAKRHFPEDTFGLFTAKKKVDDKTVPTACCIPSSCDDACLIQTISCASNGGNILEGLLIACTECDAFIKGLDRHKIPAAPTALEVSQQALKVSVLEVKRLEAVIIANEEKIEDLRRVNRNKQQQVRRCKAVIDKLKTEKLWLEEQNALPGGMLSLEQDDQTVINSLVEMIKVNGIDALYPIDTKPEENAFHTEHFRRMTLHYVNPGKAKNMKYSSAVMNYCLNMATELNSQQVSSSFGIVSYAVYRISFSYPSIFYINCFRCACIESCINMIISRLLACHATAQFKSCRRTSIRRPVFSMTLWTSWPCAATPRRIFHKS
jgi:hypothetical protein